MARRVPSAWLSVERLLEAFDDGFHRDDHHQDSVGQRVVVVRGWGRLVDRYVDGEVGIRFDVHARSPARDLKRGNLAFFFERAVRGYDEGFDSASLGWSEKRLLVSGPGRHDVESSVSILPRPIVQQIERLGHELHRVRLLWNRVRLAVAQ